MDVALGRSAVLDLFWGKRYFLRWDGTIYNALEKQTIQMQLYLTYPSLFLNYSPADLFFNSCNIIPVDRSTWPFDGPEWPTVSEWLSCTGWPQDLGGLWGRDQPRPRLNWPEPGPDIPNENIWVYNGKEYILDKFNEHYTVDFIKKNNGTTIKTLAAICFGVEGNYFDLKLEAEKVR